MRKSLAVIGVILLSALMASADEEAYKFETFVGYDFVRFNPNNTGFIPPFNANGGNAEFVYNVRQYIGVVFDAGAVTKGTLNQAAIDSTVLNFVAGPRFTFRHKESRFQPFVQALFGGAYSTASTQIDILGGEVVNPHVFPPTTIENPNLPISTRLVSSRTGFAMLAGGGLDIKLSKHIAVRPIGADYYLTRLPNFLTQNLPNHSHQNLNNFRYSAGVNFMFGK